MDDDDDDDGDDIVAQKFENCDKERVFLEHKQNVASTSKSLLVTTN